MTDQASPPRAKVRFARELTTLIVGPAMVWIIGWSSPLVFEAVVSLVGALALYELLVLGKERQFTPPIPLCIALMLALISAAIVSPARVEFVVFLTLLIVPSWFVFTANDLQHSLASSSLAVMATLYIGMLTSAMIRLRMDFAEGWRLVFFLLLVVWIGDAGAYYVGRRFGRHPLSPKISPKKTIEGLLGGLTTSMIAAVVIHLTFFRDFPLLHVVIAGLLLSVTGVIGDLAESMWKRSAGVKDSGTLIPGHGGFLDRLDSILFTAPVLYAYWYLLEHHGTLESFFPFRP